MSDTTKVLIYGASDDLVEVEGNIEGADEFNAYGPWVADIIGPDDEGRLRVTVEYGRRGGGALEWQIDVSAIDAYPSWPILFTERPDREGDPAVEITVPVGSFLNVLSEDND